MFLTPVEDEPDETGVTHRPWTTFSRVLNDLYDHPDQFKSVTPSDSWLEWLQELDDQAPFTPADKLDLMRSLWKLMEKATDGKPSHTFSIQECGWELCDRKTWAERYRPPPITQLQVLKWRHWKPAQLKDLEPTTQRALEEKLRSHWANRLISHLIPFAAEIPAMAAVMEDGDDHQEFLHLLGDARFSTLRQRCLFFERLKKQDLLQVPWTESAVRQMLSKLQAAECTPNYIQQAWDTLKWFSSKFQTLDVESLQRLQSKKKSLQETLVSTTTTPQRRQWCLLGKWSGPWNRVRLPLALSPIPKGSRHERPSMHLSWDWSGFRWVAVPASMICSTPVRGLSRWQPLQSRWWHGRPRQLQLLRSRRTQCHWLHPSLACRGWTGGRTG